MDKASVTAKLSALAQPVRLDILLAIVAHEEGVPSTRVAEIAGAMPTNTSVHLSVLKNAGLVTTKKVGRSVIYRADHDAIDGLITLLTNALKRPGA